jgi:hypothetical protein
MPAVAVVPDVGLALTDGFQAGLQAAKIST